MRFAIIADDLTGSSDSGVQFAKKGLQSVVLFNLAGVRLEELAGDVLVIDTDSRGLPSEQAYHKVSQVAQRLAKASPEHLYKKVDSTLRGNIGAEVEAVLTIFPKDFAVIAPAFPSIGRTTVQGIHYLNGKPVNETEIGRDPRTPVSKARVDEVLALQSEKKSATIYLEDLRQGEKHLHTLLDTLKKEQVELLVFDVQEEEDLSRITKYLLSSPYEVLWVGSAGLAEHLAGSLGYQEKELPLPAAESKGPALVVAGSLSQVTKGQVDYLRQMGLEHAELDTLAVLDLDGSEGEIKRCISLIQSALQNGQDAVLTTSADREKVAASFAQGAKYGLSQIQVSDQIADSMGQVVAGVLQEQNQISGLVLTGGDTAKAVSRNIEVNGVLLYREVEKGIPLGRLIGKYELPVVTKAGAFGSPEALWKSVQALKGDV